MLMSCNLKGNVPLILFHVTTLAFCFMIGQRHPGSDVELVLCLSLALPCHPRWEKRPQPAAASAVEEAPASSAVVSDGDDLFGKPEARQEAGNPFVAPSPKLADRLGITHSNMQPHAKDRHPSGTPVKQ